MSAYYFFSIFQDDDANSGAENGDANGDDDTGTIATSAGDITDIAPVVIYVARVDPPSAHEENWPAISSPPKAPRQKLPAKDSRGRKSKMAAERRVKGEDGKGEGGKGEGTRGRDKGKGGRGKEQRI